MGNSKSSVKQQTQITKQSPPIMDQSFTPVKPFSDPDKDVQNFTPVEPFSNPDKDTSVKSFPYPDEDVESFTNLHSWYKHEPLERKVVFYAFPSRGHQRGHPVQLNGKEGTELHWHFTWKLDDKKLNSQVSDICKKYPFKISCFLSGGTNVTLSIRKAKEAKDDALRIKECVRKILENEIEIKENSTVIDFMTEYIEKSAEDHIKEKREVIVPPDIFDFCQVHYPEIYYKIKDMDRAEYYNTNLQQELWPVIKTEYNVQVEDAKTACRKIYNELVENYLVKIL